MATVWTNEMLAEAASKYATRGEFLANDRRAYHVAHKRGLVDQICAHMPVRKKPKLRKWSLDAMLDLAASCDSIMDFRTNHPRAYAISHSHGWWPQISSHMTRSRPLNGYWSKERTADEAKRYSTRSDFIRRCPAAADAAYSNGWIDDVCAHMRTRGNRTMRAIYVIKAKDERLVYIGLTFDPQRRYLNHKHGRKRTSASRIVDRPHTFKVVTRFMPTHEAALYEKRLISWFVECGWEVANISDGGGPGGGKREWTLDRLQEAANGYATRGAFYKGNRKAYDAAHSYGLLDTLFAGHVNNGFREDIAQDYTVEQLEEIASKFETRRRFQMARGGAYQAAYRRGLVDHIFRNHPNGGNVHQAWDDRKIINAGRQCSSAAEFKASNYTAWKAAYRRGLLAKMFPARREPSGNESVPE